MVAELKPQPAALSLLLEPDPPPEDLPRGAFWHGYQATKTGRRRRWARYDLTGALVQHVIVRYYVHGVGRTQIAREIGYSVRQTQMLLGGFAWQPYAMPVRRELAALGIGLNRGGSGVSPATDRRLREIANAQASLLARFEALTGGGQTIVQMQALPRVRTLARLLAAGREPLG